MPGSCDFSGAPASAITLIPAGTFRTRPSCPAGGARGHKEEMPKQPSKGDAEHWRRLAAEIISAAREMTHPEAKAVMLDIANRYEKLARLAEAREKGEKSS